MRHLVNGMRKKSQVRRIVFNSLPYAIMPWGTSFASACHAVPLMRAELLEDALMRKVIQCGDSGKAKAYQVRQVLAAVKRWQEDTE
jgi:hypothetical protein